MKKEIFKRLAVICFAVAAAGAYLWVGLFLNSIDTILFSVFAAVIVIAIAWPITPMPERVRVRVRVLSLPYWLRTSRSGQKPVNSDGHNDKNQRSGGDV
jgi:hypothetical protein